MGKVVTSGREKDFRTWQKWESNAVQDTLLETWDLKVQRTAKAVVGGVFKCSWSLELRVVVVGSLDSQGVARFLIDGTGKAHVVNGTTEWDAHSGWDFLSFVDGDKPVFRVEFRRDPTMGGSDKIEIRRVKMALDLKGD